MELKKVANEDDYAMRKNKQYLQNIDKRAEPSAARQQTPALSNQSDAIPNEISIQMTNFEK